MNIIGVNTGHNSSIALSIENKVVFAISEERLNRQKNYFGIPKESLNYIYSNIISKEEVDFFGIYHDTNHEWSMILDGSNPINYNDYEKRRSKLKNRFKSKLIPKVYNFYEQKIVNQ